MAQEYGVYIVITQTGTALSRALKAVTGEAYNHASISLRSDLARMYSFGRRRPYNPFEGGLVAESIRAGTFKRFADTECIVLYKSIPESCYRSLHAELRTMSRQSLQGELCTGARFSPLFCGYRPHSYQWESRRRSHHEDTT